MGRAWQDGFEGEVSFFPTNGSRLTGHAVAGIQARIGKNCNHAVRAADAGSLEDMNTAFMLTVAFILFLLILLVATDTEARPPGGDAPRLAGPDPHR
jgi:hypothetical protein